MTDTELERSTLHAAVSSYLKMLLAVSQCLGAACPEVGGPYRHRLGRLRSRLAFDASPEALAEGTATVEKELQEYARRAAHFVSLHGTELHRTVDSLDAIVKSISQRQDFYCARLRQFASQIETTPHPTDPEHLAEVVALQATGLLGCVESMAHDTQSLLSRMREELAAVSQRLKEAEITDYVTGLMNRREMERRIEEQKAAGKEPVIVVFELSGDVRDEVAQEVAARLDSQFRHQDLVCRWTEHEFLVLFQGTREVAQARTEQVIPWIAGKYPLNNGESVEIRVDAGLVAPHLLAMQ